MNIVLDTGPLGFLTHPNATTDSIECCKWFQARSLAGDIFFIPEICDYELRRSLIRINSTNSLAKLDQLSAVVPCLPISTDAMKRAAQIWADMRNAGTPLAPDGALDGDVILAAQVLIAEQSFGPMTVATTNTKHLDLLVTAKMWRDVK